MALAKSLLLAALIGYLAIAVLVWVTQERLIFLRAPLAAAPSAPPGWSMEAVAIDSRDGTRLAGVLLLPPVTPAPLVIYYGGNAEEITGRAQFAAHAYGERAVLLVNYRGYGASAGNPGEKALVADALELYDWAAARPQIDAARIALHGRSLGSGVAVQVAAQRPARCVVLTSPFAAARDVAAEVYPWLPVAMMLRHPFDSAAVAGGINTPALILFGSTDDIVPKHHSERLAGRWGGPVERAGFDGFGHNDLDLNPRYEASIRDFLDRRL